MKFFIAAMMLTLFSIQPAAAAVGDQFSDSLPQPYRQMVNIKNVVNKIVKDGTRGLNPSHTSISFKDGEKTVHFTVYHQRSFAYRFAVIIIEPTGRNQYKHISMVDMIEEAGQSLDGFIEQVSKDEITIRNGQVADIANIQIGKKTAQRLFEHALHRFSLLTDGDD